MKNADRVVDLAWSLTEHRVLVTRNVYSAIDRSTSLHHDPVSLPLPAPADQLGTAVILLLSLHNVAQRSRPDLDAARAMDPLLTSNWSAHGHWMRVSREQQAGSGIRLGAVMTDDFEYELQHLPGDLTAAALGDALLALWRTIIASRRLTE